MTTLLRIDASTRADVSHSRKIGDALERRLSPQRTIRRDLAADPLPHLTDAGVRAFFTDPALLGEDGLRELARSDAAVDELVAADDILITLPMYNFGIPSSLKAWVDHVVRVGRTFSFDGTSFAGLLHGKRAFVVTAYGAAGYTGGPLASADFAMPYLSFVLSFIGITDVTAVPVEGMNVGAAAAGEAGALAQIGGIAPAGAVAV